MKKSSLVFILVSSAFLSACGNNNPTAKDVEDIINSNVDTQHCLYVTVKKDFLLKNSDGSFDMKFSWTAHRAGDDYDAHKCSLRGFEGHFFYPMYGLTQMQPGAEYGPAKASVHLQRSEDSGWVGSFDW